MGVLWMTAILISWIPRSGRPNPFYSLRELENASIRIEKVSIHDATIDDHASYALREIGILASGQLVKHHGGLSEIVGLTRLNYLSIWKGVRVLGGFFWQAPDDIVSEKSASEMRDSARNF